MHLESFTKMHLANAPGHAFIMSVELANNVLLPLVICHHSIVEKLTMCTLIYNAYVNDVYS